MLEEHVSNMDFLDNEPYQAEIGKLNVIKKYTYLNHILIILSKIIILISGLSSFISIQFQYIWFLYFLSGSLNFIATSLLSYSSFIIIKRKKIIKEMNSKLEKLNIKNKIIINYKYESNNDIKMTNKLLLDENIIKDSLIKTLFNVIEQQHEYIKNNNSNIN